MLTGTLIQNVAPLSRKPPQIGRRADPLRGLCLRPVWVVRAALDQVGRRWSASVITGWDVHPLSRPRQDGSRRPTDPLILWVRRKDRTWQIEWITW